MQGTTGRIGYQAGWVVLFVLAVASVMVLALLGQMPEIEAGWMVQPALLVGLEKERKGGRGFREYWRAHLAAMGRYLVASWGPVLVRSVVLWWLREWSGRLGPGWLWLVPWGLWLWQGVGMGWPRWRLQASWRWVQCGLWEAQRLLLVGYLGLVLYQRWQESALGWSLGLGCVVGAPLGEGCVQEEPNVEVIRQADGSYWASLSGRFTLTVAGDEPLRLRLLVLLLSELDVAGNERGSRRTREGRTPFVRQMQMAEWLGVPQPCISRWLRYWYTGNWANLLSLHSPEVLTAELCLRIVEVCATFPQWGVERVYQHLRQQGVAVTQAQVQQAVTQSGWQHLQQTLAARYALGESSLRLREEWLVEQLLTQNRQLLERLETIQAITPAQDTLSAIDTLAEVHTVLDDLTTLAVASGANPPPRVKARPWLLCVTQILFGPWAMVPAGPEALAAHPTTGDASQQVRCPYCGSTEVARKSATPRTKRYYDEQQQLCEVAVYRYYCHNPQCDKGSFTNLPAGLTPYSPYRTELHLLAVQMYAWGCSTYRRTGAALGVTSLTAWRWVTAWGYDLLPVAALFGVVKSSGAVGIDEKYVLVPKNDKPAAPMRRWMYVYLAVDVWTYDLLHIAIYPNNTADSAHAFLLALRTKGYHPQVIVTDLRQDYGAVIAQVFPHAAHHECIFHALQEVQRLFKQVYGTTYATSHPETGALKQNIYAIFDANTQPLAHQRFAAVLALRHDYLPAAPDAALIFDFLERHWPKLVNSIGSSLIPSTNNAVERVIRRFHQHYQNFCGFESIHHAQHYLALFEKLYRFTPFSQDAQPAIRGKSPLQLAGYDITQLPFSSLCAGLSIPWPMPPPIPVPNL